MGLAIIIRVVHEGQCLPTGLGCSWINHASRLVVPRAARNLFCLSVAWYLFLIPSEGYTLSKVQEEDGSFILVRSIL